MEFAPGSRICSASGSEPQPRREAASSMAANEILREATNLHTVSKRLHTLAEQNAPVTEALSTLATAVRQSATLLEVLVAIRMGQDEDVEKTSN